MTLKERYKRWFERHIGTVEVNGKRTSIKSGLRITDEVIKDAKENGGKIHCSYDIRGEKEEYDIN